MWFRTTGIQLLGVVALAASATAQTAPAPSAVTRTVVAATKLPTVTDVPLHFRAVAVTLTAPSPDLKPGGYDLNLTRVTFPAQTPSNPLHHRSGAALYYIISGTGANTVDGKTEAKGPGSLIYEPFGLVHQWGNPGNEPLTFLAFNINPEGVAAVLPGATSEDSIVHPVFSDLGRPGKGTRSCRGGAHRQGHCERRARRSR
jgi:quercetin dioxygenase-like cupin family protein